jgi:chromosome segregation ATPase
MTDYKSSPNRLARFFRESRDGWKQKAVERQNRLRAADVKARDLAKSRDKWKQEAKETKQRLEQLEKELEKIRGEKKERTPV